MNNVTYYRTKHFDRALKEARLGGRSRKAAVQVLAVLASLEEQDPFVELKLTNHGESRIAKCLKYALDDAWRLVTVQDNRTCGFIFMGNHDDVDRFLDEHKGARFAVRGNTLVSVPGAGLAVLDAGAGRSSNGVPLRLCQMLGDDEDYVLEHVGARAVRLIDALDSNSSAEDLLAAVAGIPDDKRRCFVLDVLGLLSAGNRRAARPVRARRRERLSPRPRDRHEARCSAGDGGADRAQAPGGGGANDREGSNNPFPLGERGARREAMAGWG